MFDRQRQGSLESSEIGEDVFADAITCGRGGGESPPTTAEGKKAIANPIGEASRPVGGLDWHLHWRVGGVLPFRPEPRGGSFRWTDRGFGFGGWRSCYQKAIQFRPS